MPDDCRVILDNISDAKARAGALIIGSDAVDVSGAEMSTGADGWTVLIRTAEPALQNPRLKTTVALYLDVDGRFENNAAAGPRAGADSVYALVYENGGWRATKEVLDVKQNAYLIAPTKATFAVGEQGYVLNIPYGEVSKNAPAFWKVGAATEETGRLSVDYAPEVGMSCAPKLASGGKAYVPMDRLAQIAAGAIVIAAVIMIIWKVSMKKRTYDNQAKPD